jgi:hypothetical protein
LILSFARALLPSQETINPNWSGRNLCGLALVFGFLIDVPLLTITFLLVVILRSKLAGAVVRTKLPKFLLFLLVAIPLIVFEEQIDCMPSWCGKVAVPPTL